jgi:hypothetical protein
LIPKNIHWRIVNLDGSEFRNRTVFSACHEFLGESSLRFDSPVESKQLTAQRRVIGLPPDLPSSLALTNRIDTATAAAGDLFRAKLTTAIRESHNRILVRKGASVTGRIIRIERLYDRVSQSLVLALKLETDRNRQRVAAV